MTDLNLNHHKSIQKWREIQANNEPIIMLSFFLQQERHLSPDGADPPRRDGAEERGREHDAAAEVVLGKVRLASYHKKMTMSLSFTEEN